MLCTVRAFSNISEEEQERMRVCFNAQREARDRHC